MLTFNLSWIFQLEHPTILLSAFEFSFSTGILDAMTVLWVMLKCRELTTKINSLD